MKTEPESNAFAAWSAWVAAESKVGDAADEASKAWDAWVAANATLAEEKAVAGWARAREAARAFQESSSGPYPNPNGETCLLVPACEIEKAWDELASVVGIAGFSPADSWAMSRAKRVMEGSEE